jgi:hypothetical protein
MQVLAMLVKNRAIGGREAKRVTEVLKEIYNPEQMSTAERGLAGALGRAFAQMEKPRSGRKSRR